MSAELAAEELLSRKSVDVSALQSFLDSARARYGWGPLYNGVIRASLRFSASFCELLVGVGDADLAKQFLTKYCPRLGDLNGNEIIIPAVVKVANVFAWADVGDALLEVLGDQTDVFQFYETPGFSEIELLLQVADAVQHAEARQALAKLAVEKNLTLRTVKTVELFWKHVILPGDAQVLKAMADKIMKKEPKDLGPFVQVFSKYVDKRDTTGKYAVLEAITAERISWLKEEVEKLDKVDKTFSWKMPFADECQHPEIQEFFEGPEESMSTEGVMTFANLHEAKSSITEYMHETLFDATCTIEVVDREEPFWKITKTREWFDDVQAKLTQYREELEELSQNYNGSPKRARRG